VRAVTVATSSTAIGGGGALTCDHRPGQRSSHRGRGSLAVRGLAASLAATAVVAPALFAFVSPAAAATNASLLAQAKVAMQQTDAIEEAHRTIPFKKGTSFTIACGVRGTNVLCTEHSGPERCVNNKPWIMLTDEFPIIKGKLGESLTFGLTWTYIYCSK
jgi:hypothetical protein